MRTSSVLAACAALFSRALAGFPPTPEGITTRDVPGQPGVSISYKRTNICETKAKAWAGYIHLPSSRLADIETNDPYNISMFFWYFEARNKPQHAPTSIYLAGGPGESSLFGAASDGGPCTVLPDGNSTTENRFSWNNHVNMLYVDQPVGTGYSYDSLINSTLDLLFLGEPISETGITPFESYNGSIPAENATFIYGTLPSQSPDHSASGSATAAKTVWHFSQAWFSSFPGYNTRDKRIILSGNSYGGYWTTVTAAYFQSQNEKIRNGELCDSHSLPVDTVFITNGCLDLLYQTEFYPMMAYNNTYGLQVIPEEVYEEATLNFTKPGGCRDLIEECRALGDLYDPDQMYLNGTVNEFCVQAELYCIEYVTGAYSIYGGRSVFDISHALPDPSPTYYPAAFFQQSWVQQDLGSPVNFTADSLALTNTFFFTSADSIRVEGLKLTESLLASGIKIAFVYGDRDYRCPWLGVEDLSLKLEWSGAKEFRRAGYQDVRVHETYEGGVVREYGNLSFTRVFESGHDLQFFQPQTAVKIFNRVVFNKDVATGELNTRDSDYTSTGPLSSFHVKNVVPPAPPTLCYLWNAPISCEVNQLAALANGTAEIVDSVIVSPAPSGGPVGAGS